MERMRFGRIALAGLAFSAVLLGSPVTAQTIDVLSIADARFGSSWTLDGSAMSVTRSKLSNPDNFGAGGTVGRDVAIQDTAAPITPALLAGIDVVFIGYLYDGAAGAFTSDELDALVDWVEAGGSMLVTCDDASYDAVCERFGHPIEGGGSKFVTAAGAGWNHAALVGPFGSVRQVQASGSIGGFGAPGAATVLLRADGGNRAMALAEVRGAGRLFLLSDVDMISNYGTSPSDDVESPNDALLANAISWLVHETNEGLCVPDATTLCIDRTHGDGRFRVRVTYDTQLGGGLSGNAQATNLTGLGARTGGLFTFFDPAVPEMLLKVLDGCGSTDHYWVFFSAGTNAGFTVTVEDLVSGEHWDFTNPDLRSAPPVQDIYALPCS